MMKGIASISDETTLTAAMILKGQVLELNHTTDTISHPIVLVLNIDGSFVLL